MADDVDWLVLLIVAPVFALLTTIPIHPRFMKFTTRSGISVNLNDVAKIVRAKTLVMCKVQRGGFS